MTTKTLATFLLIFVLPISAHAARPGIFEPIYGEDDRKDLYQVSDPMQLRLADSTVALIHSDKLLADTSQRIYLEDSTELGALHNLCVNEPFFAQPSLAFCSGALVGADLILTAGHCIADLEECRSTRVAFGFSLRTQAMDAGHLAAGDVYSCIAIVARGQDLGSGADFAVLRLDRAVEGHAPLEISRSESLENGTPLTVIGHPNGIPAKIADNAFVRRNTDALTFDANLDTFHSNSGSPVFNARDGLIVGILVSGEDDFDLDETNSCYVSKHCANDACRGESSTRIQFAASYIPSLAEKIHKTR